MDSVRRFATLVLAALLAGPAPAGEAFYDYAEVLQVQPISESEPAPPRPAGCVPGPGAPSLGETRGGSGIPSLVKALRQAADDLPGGPCAEPGPPARQIVGYRVTYRYGDSEYVRVLASDPGPRLKVRVRLEPGP